MELELRDYRNTEIKEVLPIWNEVVEEGGSFPFTDFFDEESLGRLLDHEVQARVVCADGRVVAMYVMAANLPGRCSSIANATYLVKKEYRGMHIGEMMVKDSLKEAKAYGFRMMQFNGVVDSNIHARHLYERCGFHEVGVIPKGFRVKDGHYEDMHIMLNVF